MAAALYSTVNEVGIDINSVFILSTGTPEYPRPPFNPGIQAWGTDGSEWVFCTASISIPAGSVVVISAVPGSWSVALIGGATAGGSFGAFVGVVGGSQGTMLVPAPASPQTGTYFWVQVDGNCPNVRTAASTTANAQLYDVAATAGIVGSSSPGTGSGYQITGMVISQAAGSTAGPNTAILNNPTIGANT
ncbi:hypothetical protein GP486_008514 [Trichoglossum hirsutum]|uniref:Uncharacterized protein n=1 Tax=Trichoglossum hirsutum TaxID=265104 RepID=A0A9P8IBP8_9PEZI|nr:hypothetical protein GP486_008514 [Trichoglossum hirsutum]